MLMHNEVAFTKADALAAEAAHRRAQRANTVARCAELYAQGLGPTLIAQRLGLGRTSVNKYLRESGAVRGPADL